MNNTPDDIQPSTTPSMPRLCPQCGGALGDNPRQLYCSHKCYQAAYYIKHKDKLAFYGAKRRIDKKDDIAMRRAAYRAAHRKEIAVREAAYREAHRQERAAYSAKYDATHKAERAAYAITYRKAHQQDINAYNAKYREEHREDINAYSALYKKMYPERIAAKHQAQLAYPDKEACCLCGEIATDRHHPDYRYPLLIVYLCRSCHVRLHNGWFDLIETKQEGDK